MKDGGRKEEQAFTCSRRVFYLHTFSRPLIVLLLWFYFSSSFLGAY